MKPCARLLQRAARGHVLLDQCAAKAFGFTFGGPFMSLMILFVPQVIVFSVLCTYIYRRTGSVYTGALLVSSMACWIVTGGSSMI